MKTLTVKVPEDLDLKLARIAARRGESKSALIRAALEDVIESDQTTTPHSCLDLAKDLIGTVKGPRDLSHNKRYLKGYGQ